MREVRLSVAVALFTAEVIKTIEERTSTVRTEKVQWMSEECENNGEEGSRSEELALAHAQKALSMSLSQVHLGYGAF